MNGEALLGARGITAKYGDVAALRGLSLDLYPGQIEVVLGRNGVGKTTLLHVIAGLMSPSDGQIVLEGKDITKHPPFFRAASGIALVQEGKQIFRERTVRENVQLGTFSHKMPRRERREFCSEILEAFPMLSGHTDRRAGGLSGGQQQMVAIAQAVAARPRVLLLDEPSAGLAPRIVDEVFEHVVRLRDEEMAVLLVEQVADKALEIADHVTVIDGGTVHAEGPPSEFVGSARLQEAYFGVAR